MNEDKPKKPDEGRLIDYLLNESSPEERAEVEKLCGESTEWQEAKKELEGTLGLIEDACIKLAGSDAPRRLKTRVSADVPLR